VISVLAGHHKAQGYYDETLKPLLDEHGVSYTTHTTTSAKTIIDLTRNLFVVNATQGVKQTIILLSGDGGMVDIINTLTSVLYRTNDDSRPPSIFFKPVIVLIPMGTANALAWSSKVAQDPLGTMMGGSARSLPTFQARFSPGAKLVVNEGRDREALGQDGDESITYGAVVFSWGLHASLVAMSDTAEYRKHGLDRFKMAAGKLLEESHQYRGKVKWRKAADAEWTSLPSSAHSYILASMVSNLEEHFQISPATKPLDGSLRLVAIGPEPASEIMRILGLAYQSGKHVADPQVTYEEVEALRIEFDEEDEEWRMICVDGKIIAVSQGGWVEATRIPGSGIDGRRVVELVC